jgi:Cu-Zn family superoxide dismutase
MRMKALIPLSIATALLAACGQRDSAPQPTAGDPPPATAAPAPQPAGGTVQLEPTQGNTASGTLTLTQEATGVRLAGTLQGLKPDAQFGFHIHEKGDCSAPDASSAGDHFNPANAQHGNPDGDAHHAGDMHNVKSDAQGNAQVDALADAVSLDGSQPAGVIGRAVVLHEKPDDYATQPSGNSGNRIACGVIAAG